MSRRLLVIGRGLLGKAVARRVEAGNIKFLSHGDVNKPDAFDGIDCVINLANHPAYQTESYRPDIDFDAYVASLLRNSRTHYVMVSSRKVYGPGTANPFAEDAQLKPTDNYGQNKVRSEALLSDMLGDRLTIMRLSNVVGIDWEGERAIFFRIMLESLRRSGQVVLDIDPKTRRDFITDDSAAAALVWAGREGPPGIFNLGSGIPLEVGQIVRWTLEAFGSGELVVTSQRLYDEFTLDITKLSRRIGPLCSLEMLRERCFELGRRSAYA
jgi:UDP-glucose 4-epimerase